MSSVGKSRQRRYSNELWVTDIETATLKNRHWRHVLFTSSQLQVVVMSIPPGEELGWEKHTKSDQFFRVEGGHAIIQTDDHDYKLKDGMVTVVPRGTWHNVINTSSRQRLQLYAIYGPPHHKPGTLDRTHEAERRREKRK